MPRKTATSQVSKSVSKPAAKPVAKAAKSIRRAGNIGAPDYLKKILTAGSTTWRRVRAGARPQPQPRLHNKVLLKREDQQPVFSFKLRGAYNKMAQLTPEQLQRGVICASAGNHAQGVAMAAHQARLPGRDRDAGDHAAAEDRRRQGAGRRSRAARRQLFRRLRPRARAGRSSKLTFVHPFDDPDVIAGQGTIAMEILRQHQGPIDAVFVAIGGGGLISGVANYIKAVRPEIKVIGVQMNDSDAMRSRSPASA
jgi:threonine dehydratase